MKIVMNETRTKVIEVLKNANRAMTLAEISAEAGVKVSSGTTNGMVAAGMISAVDVEIEYNKVRKDTGAIIGSGKTTVKAYSYVTDVVEV